MNFLTYMAFYTLVKYFYSEKFGYWVLENNHADSAFFLLSAWGLKKPLQYWENGFLSRKKSIDLIQKEIEEKLLYNNMLETSNFKEKLTEIENKKTFFCILDMGNIFDQKIVKKLTCALSSNELLTEIDLHGTRILKEEHIRNIFDSLKNMRNLVKLNFSNTNFTDSFCVIAAEFLNSVNQIEYINLSSNLITILRAERLINSLQKNMCLNKLNLSSNFIFTGETRLRKIEENANSNSTSVLVDISQNFLKEGDSNIVKNKNSLQQESIFCFFYSKNKTKKISLINNVDQVTETTWIIALMCKINTEHAMLYIEGILPNTQLFLKKIHITAEGIRSLTAKAEILPLDPIKFSRSEFYYQSWAVDKAKIENLLDLVKEDIAAGHVKFSITASYSNLEYVNCLEWSKRKLNQIGIEANMSLFPFSSHNVRSNYCSLI